MRRLRTEIDNEFLLLWLFRKKMALKKPTNKPLNPWDEANLLQNMKNEEIHVTTVAKQRYVYRKRLSRARTDNFSWTRRTQRTQEVLVYI
jgi:hypothetical protein